MEILWILTHIISNQLTSNTNATSDFPKHKTERVNICSHEGIEPTNIKRVVENFGSHISAHKIMIKINQEDF